jgi:DNA-binding IclR family transcriptional regulator
VVFQNRPYTTNCFQEDRPGGPEENPATMAYTHDELRHKTLAELRDIAKDIEHEAVQGYTQLNKEHLIVAICKALNIEMHAHHDVVGIDKAAIKSRIKELKQRRTSAIAAHDHAQLKGVRRRIHRLKRQIHKATV